jgi:nicotinamide-nucleotide amidase
MKAIIINIGDEILIGDTINTNAAWMASTLDAIGAELIEILVIGDVEEQIINALESALSRAEIVLFTGGLGPTHDDITKHVLCRYFDDKLILNDRVLKDVELLLSRFGRTVNELNRSQAMIPSKCEVIRNDRGTAPGMLFRDGGKIIVSMPGVPHEMKNMMAKAVLPQIEKLSKNSIFLHRHLKSFGIAEASLAELLSDTIAEMHSSVKLAFLPSPGHVKLRLSCKGRDKSSMIQILKNEERRFIEKIAEHVYGFDDDLLETVVGSLLTKQQKSLATAESCTGGKLASKITSVPGSSDYFKGSVIAYSNEVKLEMLHVSSDLIKNHGAVSEEVVMAMAEGLRKAMKVDYVLATSGIAGPEGGTEEKPVGTIWIALSSGSACLTKKLSLGFNRKANIDLTADHCLDLLRKELSRKA